MNEMQDLRSGTLKMGPKTRDPGPLLYMRPETQYNEMTPGTFMIGET